ncbi:MAG: hypothetical protein ABW277_28065 [Longimicrobiaceae bacterium]
MLSSSVTVVLTFCAVVVTGLVVRREFFQNPAGAAQAQAPREIMEWKQVAATGSVIGRPDAP